MQEQEARGEKKQALLADVMAHSGRFAEAAKLYKSAGRNSKAVDMYTDLRMFELAQVSLPYVQHNTDTVCVLVTCRGGLKTENVQCWVFSMSSKGPFDAAACARVS